MTREELLVELRELERLYVEHGKNQREENLQLKNKLRLELGDRYLRLKPQIKKRTRLQWYEPVYSYAITGNQEYIETVREDLGRIIDQCAAPDASEA
ncbi:MAG TPA: hypothetical protein VES58_08855 [Syntrophobacteria bacterium]|jgi:hypothetical protein|nr:hypothetical protein [Syntrophobacteria bacterium]